MHDGALSRISVSKLLEIGKVVDFMNPYRPDLPLLGFVLFFEEMLRVKGDC